MHVTTVARSTLPGVVGVVLYAALAALGANLALRFVLVTPRALSAGEWWAARAVTGVVSGIPTAVLYRRLHSWRFWLFGACFVCMSAAIMDCVSYLAEAVWSLWHVTLVPYPGLRLVPVSFEALDAGISVFLGTAAAWTLSRIVRGRIVIDERILCPTCGYCIAGSENLICPECGRPFTWEELGVTPECAAGHRDLRVRLARPVTDNTSNVSHRES